MKACDACALSWGKNLSKSLKRKITVSYLLMLAPMILRCTQHCPHGLSLYLKHSSYILRKKILKKLHAMTKISYGQCTRANSLPSMPSGFQIKDFLSQHWRELSLSLSLSLYIYIYIYIYVTHTYAYAHLLSSTRFFLSWICSSMIVFETNS